MTGATLKRSRSRSPSPHVAKRLKHDILETFLKNHIAITTPFSGHEMECNRYQTTRRVYYDSDREIGLYSVWDTDQEKDTLFWARCIYALGTRVDWKQIHVPGCSGRPQDMPRSFIGMALAQCGCPVETFNRRKVWLVDPKYVLVSARGTVVRHDTECIL